MSTKNTILLSEDNEHWYHDCSDDSLVIEIHKKNYNYSAIYSDGSFSIRIPKGSSLWDEINKLNAWYKRTGE